MVLFKPFSLDRINISTMNDYCLPLDINLNSALTTHALSTLGQSQENFFIPIDDATVFNQDWVKHMLDIGLPFIGAGIIPYTATTKRLVHIDASPDPDKIPIVAFNAWLHTPNNIQMTWYKWPKEDPIKYLERPTIWYWPDEVEHKEVYRDPLSFQRFYAVRIDIPHTATPNEPFVAMSLRVPIDFYQSWEQIVKHLTPYTVSK